MVRTGFQKTREHGPASHATPRPTVPHTSTPCATHPNVTACYDVGVEHQLAFDAHGGAKVEIALCEEEGVRDEVGYVAERPSWKV